MTVSLNLSGFKREVMRASLMGIGVGARRVPAEILEFGNRHEIIVEAYSRIANAGHVLILEVYLKSGDGDERVIFQGTGKVTSFTEVDNTFRVTMQLSQFDRKSWEQLCGRTSAKQRDINELLLRNKC